MKRRSLHLVAAFGVSALALGSCGDDDDGSGGSGRLRVVASFYPLAEATARVGGDRVRVTNLTPSGAEPHDLELTPRDIDALEDADVVLYLGGGFQPAVEETAERRSDRAVDVLDAIELEEGASALLETDADDHGDQARDPHFWLDPQRFARAVDAIEEALVDASPDDADSFRLNADRYRAELTELDRELVRGLSDCTRTEIVTAHAAFYYLAERYDLTQLPVTGLSPEAEPDPSRIARLTDEIKRKGITTVFSETLLPRQVAETLAREAGVTTAVLNPIEGLTKQELADGKDYAAVMGENLAALRLALGCA